MEAPWFALQFEETMDIRTMLNLYSVVVFQIKVFEKLLNIFYFDCLLGCKLLENCFFPSFMNFFRMKIYCGIIGML